MKKELQEKLFEKYPKIFGDRKKSPQETLMCFGCECGDGWYNLIDILCSQLQHETDKNGHPQVVAFQVKEKFGGLRFYIGEASDDQHAYISFAEAMSYHICESCGTMEDVEVRRGGWIVTLCNTCDEKRKKKNE